MFTLQENVRSLCISSVFRILKIPTAHFLPHSSHIWRRCPLLQYCYQTDAIFAAKQCRAALISTVQAQRTRSWQVLEFTMHLTTAMWSESNDRVRNLWGYLLCVCNLPCSRALTTGSWRQKYSPCIVYCIASVGRRLVTHKQSHQRNWPGTL